MLETLSLSLSVFWAAAVAAAAASCLVAVALLLTATLGHSSVSLAHAPIRTLALPLRSITTFLLPSSLLYSQALFSRRASLFSFSRGPLIGPAGFAGAAHAMLATIFFGG